MELYGPTGLRTFIRTILNMTDSQCQDKYAVHELLRRGERPSAPCTPDVMRANEMEGRDIMCGDDGFWRECVKVWSNRARREIVVDAGQVVHRGEPSVLILVDSKSLIAFQVPCLGYVIRESPNKGEEAQATTLGRLRKLVVLGDTNNPDEIIPLVNSSPGHVALAVHEATDCYIPTHVDPQQQTGKNRSVESVHSVSLQRGHSTPHMAGKFANEIGARRLVLNHLGGRYDPLPRPVRSGIECSFVGVCRFPAPGRNGSRSDEFRESVMGWIEHQATEAWAPEEDGARAKAAFDFLTVHIKPVPVPVLPESGETEPQVQWTQSGQPSSSTGTGQNPGQTSEHGGRHGRYTSNPPTSSNGGVPRKRQMTKRRVGKWAEDATG